MSVTYYEHYPHYMGTLNATIKFTDAEFANVILLAKKAIKLKKSDEEAAYVVIEEIEDYVKKITNNKTLYAFEEALLNFFDSPRRPSTIISALKRKGVWSGEWEEGSHAFASTKNKAKKAVAVIEAKHTADEF